MKVISNQNINTDYLNNKVSSKKNTSDITFQEQLNMTKANIDDRHDSVYIDNMQTTECSDYKELTRAEIAYYKKKYNVSDMEDEDKFCNLLTELTDGGNIPNVFFKGDTIGYCLGQFKTIDEGIIMHGGIPGKIVQYDIQSRDRITYIDSLINNLKNVENDYNKSLSEKYQKVSEVLKQLVIE